MTKSIFISGGSAWLLASTALAQVPATQAPAMAASEAKSSVQSAAPADADAPARSDSGGVQDIVVTAQRRSERLQNVPIAVNAATADRLAAVGIQSTQDLSVITPGLSVPQTAGFTQPHIRGVGTSAQGPGVENPVATYIDGVYIASAPSSLLTLNNVDRIEVLKGPQGTLFGRNSTGGLIQVVTRDPKQTPSAHVNLTYGNYKDVVADAYVTGGITSNLAADVAVRYEHQGDGFGRNLFNGQPVGTLDHDLAARTKFLFTPGPDTKIRLALDYEDRSSTRDIQHLGTQYASPFDNAFFGGPFPQGKTYDVNQNFPFLNRLKGGGAALQINQDIGGVTLQSITAYRKSRFDFNLDLDLLPVNLISADITSRFKQFSQELQLSSNTSGRLKWVAGVYYFYSKEGFQPLVIGFGPLASPVPGQPGALTDRNNEVTNAIAGYAQATYEVLKDTNLTLGGRYNYEKKSISGTETLSINGVPISTTPYPVSGLGIPDTLNFKKFNYRIALDHKFSSDIMGYISYNTGFKSGGFVMASSTSTPFKPEDIKAAEIGLKSELFDRHLRLNVSGFHYDYRNIQVQRYAAGNTITYNGAKAQMNGADLDAELALTRSFTLNAGFSYIHARFKSFPLADFIVPIGGCVPAPGGVCSGSAAGKKLPMTPTTTLNVGGDYKIATQIGTIALNATYFRSGKFYGAADNVAFQKAYDLVNASVSWTDVSGHLSVKVWGKNLTRSVYLTSILEGNTGLDVSLGYPRTYGVTAGFKF